MLVRDLSLITEPKKMDDSLKKFIWFFGIIEGYRRLSEILMCLKNKGQMTKY